MLSTERVDVIRDVRTEQGTCSGDGREERRSCAHLQSLEVHPCHAWHKRRCHAEQGKARRCGPSADGIGAWPVCGVWCASTVLRSQLLNCVLIITPVEVAVNQGERHVQDVGFGLSGRLCRDAAGVCCKGPSSRDDDACLV